VDVGARLAGLFQSRSADFYLKEYECLRKEIDSLSSEYQSLEKNAAVAVGVTLAWLFHERSSIPGWTWFVPFLFAVLGASRSRGLSRTFELLNSYMILIEHSFTEPNGPDGWAHHSNREQLQPEGIISFWRVLFYATFALGIYGTLQHF